MGYREYRFFVIREAILQWFLLVTKSRVKIIVGSPHKWQNIGIHGDPYIILFLTRYFMPRSNTQIR